MSFRHKKKDKTKEADEDMKVSRAKDSQAGDTNPPSPAEQTHQAPQEQRRTEQAPLQQEESDQASEQSDDEQQSDEQQSDDEDDSDDAEPVPEGSTAEILRWVGGDKKRAQAALDKEQAEERPRTGLTGELKKILE